MQRRPPCRPPPGPGPLLVARDRAQPARVRPLHAEDSCEVVVQHGVRATCNKQRITADFRLLDPRVLLDVAELNVGNSYWLRLENQHMAPEFRADSPASAPLAPCVLVVEDYQDAREMYVEYLKFSGFRVAEARNGVEALERALSLLPDIILMDLALPRMDGWEATRRLKADGRTRHIPVVALTGHALAGHAEGARQAGCDAFVTKPCLPDALVSEIHRVLDLQRTGNETSAASVAPGVRPETR